jgi:hypothetical protein
MNNFQTGFSNMLVMLRSPAWNALAAISPNAPPAKVYMAIAQTHSDLSNEGQA